MPFTLASRLYEYKNSVLCTFKVNDSYYFTISHNPSIFHYSEQTFSIVTVIKDKVSN